MTKLSDTRMPAAFLGHGSPMNALEVNRYTQAWRAFGASVPRPRAILVVSAHWYTAGTAVTAMAKPRTIHDFGGFPQALFDVRYPAAGDPALAEALTELVEPTKVALDRSTWGLDHGTWSVLCHAFPRADVPVLQLSIDGDADFESHVELGARLAPLRSRGVLIIGSGNIVHNLRAIAWQTPESGFDWAERFDAAATEILRERPAEILRLREHPDYTRAVPTPDHFVPLLYIAGLAAADGGGGLHQLVSGCSMGSLSMTSHVLDGSQ
ncbi:MAG: 4,5-DOPA dioxygenase extradiol [Polyangiales bacterium]